MTRGRCGIILQKPLPHVPIVPGVRYGVSVSRHPFLPQPLPLEDIAKTVLPRYAPISLPPPPAPKIHGRHPCRTPMVPWPEKARMCILSFLPFKMVMVARTVSKS